MAGAGAGVLDPPSRAVAGSLAAWAGATVLLACVPGLPWWVGPAAWATLPLAWWLARGPELLWGLPIPREPGQAALDVALACAAFALIGAWVAGRQPGAPATTSNLLAHLLWIVPAEELFFRGLLQGAIRARVGAAAAIAASAGCFALSHALIGGSAAGLATIFPGLLFAAARERHGTLTTPILLHAAANIAVMAPLPD